MIADIAVRTWPDFPPAGVNRPRACIFLLIVGTTKSYCRQTTSGTSGLPEGEAQKFTIWP